MRNDWLTIAEVTRPQGVRGEIRLRPLTHDALRFSGMRRLILEKDGQRAAHEIERLRIGADGMVYAAFKGIDSRDAAEELRGALVVVPRDEAAPPPDGAWFIADLIGCDVYDDAGRSLGRLREVLQHGAADVWVVEGERSMMIPALKRAIVSVDTEKGRIVLSAQELAAIAVVDGANDDDL